MRVRHRMPSISCRRVHTGGRPGLMPRGSSGSSRAHWPFVRSPRPTAGDHQRSRSTFTTGPSPVRGGPCRRRCRPRLRAVVAPRAVPRAPEHSVPAHVGVSGLVALGSVGRCGPVKATSARPAIEDEAVQAERVWGGAPGPRVRAVGGRARNSPRPWRGWCWPTRHTSSVRRLRTSALKARTGFGAEPQGVVRVRAVRGWSRSSPRPWQGWCRPTWVCSARPPRRGWCRPAP